MLKKIKAPRYKVGDMVYSYQNPTVKREISYVIPSTDAKYQTKYKLTLVDRYGYGYSSKWINESSLSRYKKS